MERKLASIQKVQEIIPILGADSIELVKINGWQCVVKRGEFQVGELGLFLEIDSVPPDIGCFQFLWQPRNSDSNVLVERPANFRIRTIKLRGALSQGLFTKLHPLVHAAYTEGADVTEILGVTKYETPDPATGGHNTPRVSTFPTHLVPKTDEPRVQSNLGVLDELRGHPYVMTLKHDGSSATYLIDPANDKFLACSRNHIVGEDSPFYQIAVKYGIEEKLREFPHLAIQGELCGPGIQKNRLGLDHNVLFVFNIYDLERKEYRNALDVLYLCNLMRLAPCPVVKAGDSFNETLESLLAKAEGKYDGTNNEREGLVIRPQNEMYSQTLRGRLSFKAISNRFLLKGGE